jgi:hypothetical protein
MTDLKAAIHGKWLIYLYISDENKIRVGWSSHFLP